MKPLIDMDKNTCLTAIVKTNNTIKNCSDRIVVVFLKIVRS